MCLGVVEYFGLEIWLVRILVVIGFFLLVGFFIFVVYIVVWFIFDKKFVGLKNVLM